MSDSSGDAASAITMQRLFPATTSCAVCTGVFCSTTAVINSPSLLNGNSLCLKRIHMLIKLFLSIEIPHKDAEVTNAVSFRDLIN